MAATVKIPKIYVLSASGDLTDKAFTGQCRIRHMSFWNGHATEVCKVTVHDGITAAGQVVLEVEAKVNVPFHAYYGEAGLPMSTGIFVTFGGATAFPCTLIIQLA